MPAATATAIAIATRVVRAGVVGGSAVGGTGAIRVGRGWEGGDGDGKGSGRLTSRRPRAFRAIHHATLVRCDDSPGMIVPVQDMYPADTLASPLRPSWRGHLAIARLDHWFKNVFVLPGIVVALGTDPSVDRAGLGWRILVGLLSVCLIASSNYTLNELIDAPFDKHHPTKHRRPVPSGQVSVPLGYVQWLVLMIAGLAVGRVVSVPFML